MLTHKRVRVAALMSAMMLATGFAYSGVATVRQIYGLVRLPAVAGRSATIDAYLAPANLESGEDLRRAVRSLGPFGEEIVLLADGPALSPHDFQQISYATSYLLYPLRIVLRTGRDPMTTNALRLSLVPRH